MRRVAEIIHIVEADRERFLHDAINADEETQKMLWLCGVREQQYFALNEIILMTFEYSGKDFKADMAKMAAYLDSKGHLVQTRRRDVPVEERETTNWWAPLKKIGSVLEKRPAFDYHDDSWQHDYMAILDGGIRHMDFKNDTAFDEDDWSESIHI